MIVTLKFSNQLVAELVQPFWAALQAGEFLTDAAAEARASRPKPAKLATNRVLRARSGA